MILICRVLCIFLMMAVHFGPGHHEPTALNSGPLAALGLVWIDYLSRASVAVLSVISGYLLAGTRSNLSALASAKAQALILPMMAWNLVFIGIKILAAAAGVGAAISVQGPVEALSLVTGALGQTANPSLFFLRDLFVASLIVYLVLPLLTRPQILVPTMVITLFAAESVLDLSHPVIFRPTILLFVALGALLRCQGATLTDLSSPRIVLPMVGVTLGLWMGLSVQDSPDLQALANVMKRMSLVFLMFYVARYLVGTRAGHWIGQSAALAFPTYLCHAILFGVIWIGYRSIGGDAMGWQYVTLLAAAPFVAFAAGAALTRIARALPSALQIALTGRKSRRLPDCRPEGGMVTGPR